MDDPAKEGLTQFQEIFTVISHTFNDFLHLQRFQTLAEQLSDDFLVKNFKQGLLKEHEAKL